MRIIAAEITSMTEKTKADIIVSFREDCQEMEHVSKKITKKIISKIVCMRFEWYSKQTCSRACNKMTRPKQHKRHWEPL